MILKARGKINLSLDVTGKRSDGYHEVRMIMQSVKLCDILEIRKSGGEEICLHTNLPFLPTDKNNLVWRAVQMLREEFGIREGVEIALTKKIPVAAGMAGGSTDAAAAMVGINRMFRLGLTKQELMERGVRLGADIPYCIMRGTALAEGIGEVLTELPPMPHCYFVLGKPAVSVSTKFVYTHLDREGIHHHPDIEGMIRAIREGSLTGVASQLENVLEQVTIQEHPVIEKIKTCLLEQGAEGTLMSGSGPTVFGIFTTWEKARNAASVLRQSRLARMVYVTEPFQNCFRSGPAGKGKSI